MAGSAGRFEQIGSRLTYVPPFVNERFDGPPFWACTFSALLNGANVAWMGQKPATYAEVAALAGASGDSDTRGGSRSSHMVRAIKVRYKKNVGIERCSAKEAQRRLANGGALVAGVTYGELPARYRRWSPGFKRGHRVTLIGLSGDRTRLIDPLAAKGADYGGEWISWSDFARAWWPAEQLWFQEGEYVNPAVKPVPKSGGATPVGAGAARPPATAARVLRRFDPPRHFRIAAKSLVVAFAPGRPPKPVRKILFPHASGANFDAIVAFEPDASIDDRARSYLQVTNGAFARRYIPLATPGLSAEIGVIQPVPAIVTPAAPPAEPAAGVPAATFPPDLGTAILEGRRQEWDRIAHALAGLVVLPTRP